VIIGADSDDEDIMIEVLGVLIAGVGGTVDVLIITKLVEDGQGVVVGAGCAKDFLYFSTSITLLFRSDLCLCHVASVEAMAANERIS
jgi:hypothetical protein